MQLKENPDTIKRFLVYLCGLYSTQLKPGMLTNTVKEVTQVVFLDYNLDILEDEASGISRFKLSHETEDKKLIKINEIEFILVEMPKILEIPNSYMDNKINRLVWVFNKPYSKEVEYMKGIDPAVNEIVTQYNKIMADPITRRYIEMQERAEQERLDDLDWERKQGREEGREQNKEETIIALYNKGLSVDFLSDAMNMPIEKVEEIIEKHTKTKKED